MNYGRVASGIGLVLMAVSGVIVLFGLVVLWFMGPVGLAIVYTIAGVATGTMMVLYERDDRRD